MNICQETHWRPTCSCYPVNRTMKSWFLIFSFFVVGRRGERDSKTDLRTPRSSFLVDIAFQYETEPLWGTTSWLPVGLSYKTVLKCFSVFFFFFCIASLCLPQVYNVKIGLKQVAFLWSNGTQYETFYFVVLNII